jgi:Sec-independent protein translocase protein TatA
MRSVGRGVVEFKRGVAGIEDDVEEATKVGHDKSSDEQA